MPIPSTYPQMQRENMQTRSRKVPDQDLIRQPSCKATKLCIFMYIHPTAQKYCIYVIQTFLFKSVQHILVVFLSASSYYVTLHWNPVFFIDVYNAEYD